jgi:hypothetical protein
MNKQKARELNQQEDIWLTKILIEISKKCVYSTINGRQYIDNLDVADLIKILRESRHDKH